MDTPVMITMAYAEPYVWVIASVGLLLMCVGIWIAGYYWSSIATAIPFSWAIYLVCFTKGEFWWMSGWMWIDRRTELVLFSAGALMALGCTLQIIGERLFPEAPMQAAEDHSSDEPKATSEPPVTPE